MICLLWGDKEELPEKVTTLYEEALLFLTAHKEAKYSEEDAKYSEEEIEENKLQEQLKAVVLRVGEVALKGLFENRLIFNSTEFTSDLDDLCHIGLLSKENARSRFRRFQQVTFLHKTFQRNVWRIILGGALPKMTRHVSKSTWRR